MYRLSKKKDVLPPHWSEYYRDLGTFDMKCVLNYDDYETMKSI